MVSMGYSSNLKHLLDPNKVPDNMKKFSQFRYHFFTIWNYVSDDYLIIYDVFNYIVTFLAFVLCVLKTTNKFNLFIFMKLHFAYLF